VEVFEPVAEARWTRLRDAGGVELPARILAVRSLHAPQLGRYNWAKGEVATPAAQPVDGRATHSLRAGTTVALVIDLLDPAQPQRPLYRIYYQDSVNRGDWGFPPALADGHGYDLAILTGASYYLVDRAPTRLLAALRPRHVLLTHFEDFFRDPARPTRFVPMFTNARANELLRRVNAQVPCEGAGTRGPRNERCGPSCSGWTMPVVGEWLVF
jgi:hypothetical protein